MVSWERRFLYWVLKTWVRIVLPTHAVWFLFRTCYLEGMNRETRERGATPSGVAQQSIGFVRGLTWAWLVDRDERPPHDRAPLK